MMRIMFIMPSFPYPLLSGGDQAMYNSMFAVEEDVECYFIYETSFRNKKNYEKKIKDANLEKVCFIPLVPNLLKNLYISLNNRLNNFVHKYRFRCEKEDFLCFKMSKVFFLDSKKADFIQFINACIKKYNIDIVQMEMCSCLPYVLALPSNVKKIFVHHEIRFVVNELFLHSKGFSPYRQAVTEMSKIQEIGLLNKCDAVITLSEIDKQKLKKAGVNIPVYSSVAVVNTVADIINPNDCCNVLSFVGPAFHSPNYLGVKWFLENCWEKLLLQDASYRLRIIGNWPEDRRNEITQKFKNVEFAGFVPNLADALNDTIMIVPITVGSGIRMKILEAASLGVPFVSTTVGAEGLPFESGKDCLKGDTPEEFVDAILKMRDKSLRVEFAKKANKLVKEKYSMDALRKNRLEIYEKVMNGIKS